MTNPNRNDVSMDERMPVEVELQGIGLSFTLGAGKNLSRTWDRELRTESESRFRASVTRNSLEINFSPPILIDAQWPAMNMEFGGVKREFATGDTTVYLAPISGVTEGLIDYSEDAKKEIGQLISQAVRGTAMQYMGYNPMQDPRLVSTLEALADHFAQQPQQGKSDVEYRDFGSVRIDINLALKTDYKYVEKNAGLSLKRETKIDVSIDGRGNMATLIALHTTSEKAMAAQIQSVTITSDGILVILNDKPIAYLDRLRIDRGGAVSLEKLRLEGVAGEASGIESLLRVVVSAMQWTSHGVAIENAAVLATNSRDVVPTLIPDMVRTQIESTLTEGTKKILKANRLVVPEIDIEQVFLV